MFVPGCPMAAMASRTLAAVILKGGPPVRPRARAEARPALERSAISSRSNSASAAKMLNTSLPAGVVVSTEAPCPVSTLNPISCYVRPTAARIPPSRLASLARFAGTAKVTAIKRLPAIRRLATLAAFVHDLEATAHDDALEVLERLLRDRFGQAMTADKKARLRTLKDLDQAATTLAGACQIVLDSA